MQRASSRPQITLNRHINGRAARKNCRCSTLELLLQGEGGFDKCEFNISYGSARSAAASSPWQKSRAVTRRGFCSGSRRRNDEYWANTGSFDNEEPEQKPQATPARLLPRAASLSQTAFESPAESARRPSGRQACRSQPSRSSPRSPVQPAKSRGRFEEGSLSRAL